MKIALELGLNAQGKRGVDAYFSGIVGGLAEIDRENRYSLFAYFYRDFEKNVGQLPLPARPNFEMSARRWPQSVVDALEWRWGVPIIDLLFARRGGFSLYHGMGGRVPRLSRLKSVVTVYDLIPELFPEEAGGAPTGTDVYARRAAHVITISKSTKDDLVRVYGVDPAKVTSILLAVDHDVFKPADEAELARVRSKYGLDAPFLMLMGPFDFRRNHGRILEAVASLKGERRLLAFVGRRNAQFDKIEEQARKLGLGAEVRCLGYVPQADLPALYGASDGLVYPSLYEGFGLSVLEAMASGAPVITSNVSSMPEVAGDAALLVDPTSVDAIAKALRDLPKAAGALREKGLARAKTFTWRKAAEETLEVYRRVAK